MMLSFIIYCFLASLENIKPFSFFNERIRIRGNITFAQKTLYNSNSQLSFLIFNGHGYLNPNTFSNAENIKHNCL